MFSEDLLKGDELFQIKNLAHQLDDIDQDIAIHEHKLKELQKRKKEISEISLPELMNLLGMADFSLTNGKKVKLNTFYDAKIKDQQAAFAYLDKTGDASIIKDTITLNFDRGDHAWANEITENLSEQGVNLSRKEAIHPSTLKAYVKEKIESGANIPYDAFGIYVGNRVTIK